MRSITILVVGIVLGACFALAQGASPEGLYLGADVVFVGRLQAVKPVAAGLSGTFEIEQSVKGIQSKKLTVGMPKESKCHALEENHSYLVYAQRQGDTVWIDPCAGTKLESMAESDLRYLHTINPSITERCNSRFLRELASQSPIIVEAEVVGTEESMGVTSPLLLRPWCGLTWSTEDAFYKTVRVLKGDVPDVVFVAEHPICWDTVTVDGYVPELSPELFENGNNLLLFLKPVSRRMDKHLPVPFKLIYSDVDENCGAVMSNSEAAQSAIRELRENSR